MTPVSELCDVYTETGQPIGRTVPRSEIDTALTADEYVKSVLVLVHTPDGRFLVTRRSAEKRWGAGMWELPGGGVQAGETGAEAAARELAEETGLAVSPGEARLLLAYHREYHYLVDNFESSFTIPGLYEQNIPEYCKDMVVQGIAKTPQHILVSAYSK